MVPQLYFSVSWVKTAITMNANAATATAARLNANLEGVCLSGNDFIPGEGTLYWYEERSFNVHILSFLIFTFWLDPFLFFMVTYFFFFKKGCFIVYRQMTMQFYIVLLAVVTCMSPPIGGPIAIMNLVVLKESLLTHTCTNSFHAQANCACNVMYMYMYVFVICGFFCDRSAHCFNRFFLSVSWSVPNRHYEYEKHKWTCMWHAHLHIALSQ